MIKSAIKNADGIEMIAARNKFFPLAYQLMAKIVVWQSATIIVMIISLTAVIIFRPSPQSYAVSPDGKITPLVPLKEGVGHEAIIDFSSKAILASFSMDFQNWQQQIGGLSKYFTADGLNGFVAAIAPIKDRVVDGRYVTSVGFAQPPVIAKSAVIDGTMKYKVTAQILIGFEGQSKKITPQLWDIALIVERIDMSKSVNGVAISSLIATPAH